MRKKVSEWWEVWWKKPGAIPYRIAGDRGGADPFSREGWPNLESARRFVALQHNIYLKIIHVVRYRR